MLQVIRYSPMELKLSFISFVSAILINYSLPLQYSKLVNFSSLLSSDNLPYPVLSKIGELIVLLILSWHLKLIW